MVIFLESPADGGGTTMSSMLAIDPSIDKREDLVLLSLRLSRRVLSPRTALFLFKAAFGLLEDSGSGLSSTLRAGCGSIDEDRCRTGSWGRG